ncbi:MAG: hypothetical protein PHH00_01920 [Candidatus Nanoarchaeia archaeon]|nr:hypothetical protein [Candidatus Nanoarchaeia archaeon]
MATIHEIIAAVNPDLYYMGDKKELKKLVAEKGYLGAINEIKDKKKEFKTKAVGYSYKNYVFQFGGDLEAKHTIVYDSSSETLEPIYFFILDLMNDMKLSPEKIIDNFTSSPGSGHFAELGQRATIMQQQASKILGDINNVVRSILNLVYDLKEFKIRLQGYNDLKAQSKETKEAALLSLKQIWMDKVDISKGNSSIKAMAVAGGVGYQTLIDAFLFVQDESQADKVDLNDRVKRIIKQRIHEFNLWLAESERELRKRYEIERKYLKSQVNSVKIYSRWAKPYLKAAQQLEMKDNARNPALIKAFNTIILELTLLGKSKQDIWGAVQETKLPKEFKNLEDRKQLKRQYNSCVVVDFNFRGIPQKTTPYQSHYTFGGRTDITFSGYALSNEELKMINKELEKSDMEDALKLFEDTTTGSLEQLQADIDEFLNEEDKSEKKEKGKEKPASSGSNPFMALLGFYNEKPEAKPQKSASEEKTVKPDNFLEKAYLRPLAAEGAEKIAFDLFEIYKKAHGMPTYP